MNKTLQLYLIRHGHVSSKTIYGRSNISLNYQGYTHINNIGIKLAILGIRPDEIWSSPLPRAQQSAEVLSNVFGYDNKKIIYREDLQEVDFGEEITGKPISFFDEVGDNLFTHDFSNKPRSKEQPEQFVQRVKGVIQEIIEKSNQNDIGRDKKIFIIGHGDPFSFLLSDLINPEKPYPSVAELINKKLYLEKGDIGRVTFYGSDTSPIIDIIRYRNGNITREGYNQALDYGLQRRK